MYQGEKGNPIWEKWKQMKEKVIVIRTQAVVSSPSTQEQERKSKYTTAKKNKNKKNQMDIKTQQK